MADYSKTTNFTAKDALPTGNPAKVIKGSEHDTEFNNISTAVATKANKIASATNNRIVTMDASGDIQDGGNATCSAGAITAASFTGPLTGDVTGTILDTNGNEVLKSGTTASAVNEITATNSATGNAPSLMATGNDTNIDLELDGKGTGRATTKSIPIYGLVILDTPEELIAGGALTTLSWTTVNSTTLNTANAKKAIVKCIVDVQATGSTNTEGAIYLRKTGSSLAFDNTTSAAWGADRASASATLKSFDVGVHTVNLDSSSDFDYYYISAGSGTVTDNSSLVLVGYYV